MDLTSNPLDVSLKQYQQTLESYDFKDYFGLGDLTDTTLGGYHYDDVTVSSVSTWFRTKVQELRAKGQPWSLAVNFVNPHDVMYFNSDLPGENIQSKSHAMSIARAPNDDIYNATWNDVPLPPMRRQSFDASGRSKGQKLDQQIIDLMIGRWPNEDRR
ncbi:hypothetical protein [Polynucleobacter necessarius]|uniref:hypothetical protein n=1 Tax=Polynucleobacter necessarius TaxID=576610 RepID=UPI0018D532CF|nr:hypothetical protein [Polynucleobacter necessarius]